MRTLHRRALDAAPYPPAVLDALVAAIDVNDLIDLAAPLPTAVTVDHPAERFVEGFRLSRQLWQAGFDRVALRALAAGVMRGAALDDDARLWFKQVRARFKHLRFAFFLYAAGHRAPPLLSLVTLVMGELQDAVRVADARGIRRHARRLHLLLAEPLWRGLAWEADRLTPSDTAGFRRFTAAQMGELRTALAPATIGAHAFHRARKIISRQVSFHDDMRVLHPSDEHRAMARWLATLNGLMGQAHDDLVTRHAAGTFDYARDTLALPEEIRARIEATSALYLGTSSSLPSAA